MFLKQYIGKVAPVWTRPMKTHSTPCPPPKKYTCW